MVSSTPRAPERQAHLAGCVTCLPSYAALVGAGDAVSAAADSDAVVPPDIAARSAEIMD
jgi:hypothetical protein